jgi:flagellar motor protein MotB
VNKVLSLKRAKTVQDYLTNRGIDTARITISGEAADFPLNMNNPYAPENRRVQFDRMQKEE